MTFTDRKLPDQRECFPMPDIKGFRTLVRRHVAGILITAAAIAAEDRGPENLLPCVRVDERHAMREPSFDARLQRVVRLGSRRLRPVDRTVTCNRPPCGDVAGRR